VPNPDGRLRAGMFGTVRFHPTVSRQALVVPTQAVLRTGQRNVVIVDLGDGSFAPREVQTGHEGGGYVEILEGLDEGDRIVTSSQFLIDSESNLQAAVQKMIAQRSAQEDH
ncbi:MAG: efflux RND transporter periplasmic adaptor subunit, partial [Thermoanaerobaculia bacterium]